MVIQVKLGKTERKTSIIEVPERVKPSQSHSMQAQQKSAVAGIESIEKMGCISFGGIGSGLDSARRGRLGITP
jgi:hypothetical protein